MGKFVVLPFVKEFLHETPSAREALKRVVLVGLGDKEPNARDAGAAIAGAVKGMKGGTRERHSWPRFFFVAELVIIVCNCRFLMIELLYSYGIPSVRNDSY